MKGKPDLTIKTFEEFAELSDLICHVICDAAQCVPVEGVREVEPMDLRNFVDLEEYWKEVRDAFHRDTRCGKDIDNLMSKLSEGRKVHLIELMMSECFWIQEYLRYADGGFIEGHWPLIGSEFRE